MSEAATVAIDTVKAKKKWNPWVITSAVLALALTATGLGVGLSQSGSTDAPATQTPGFVKVSGSGSLEDKQSYVSGDLGFPSSLPLQTTGNDTSFLHYEKDKLTPKPTYTVGVSSRTNPDLAPGADITGKGYLLTKLREGDTFVATYDVVTNGAIYPLYSFKVTYAVQPRLLNKTSSLYDDVSYVFNNQAQKDAALLPVISVKTPDGAYVTPVYTDAADKVFTNEAELRNIPNGSSFSATYTATSGQNVYKFVVTYVVNVDATKRI